MIEEIVERASTITERLNSGFVLDQPPENDPIVDSRIEQWCQVVAQGDWEKFEQRLAWDGLDLSTVRCVLGSVRLSNDQQLPTWAKTLDKCLQANTAVNLDSLTDSGKNRFLNPQSQLPFEEVLLPFIYVARQNLLASAGNHYNLVSEKAHASLERGLLRWLSFLCSSPLELEFSVFRASRKSTLARLKGKLSGANSNQQYQDFIQTLLTGGLLAFFQEYPVLARLVATVTDLWVDANNEFLWRLASDWSEIQSTFQDETELGQVVAVRPFLSDRHHNGRSVTAVTFVSGLKLIYKPKDLSIEQAYFQLLAWLNEHEVPLSFKLLKVLNRSNYGWVEFVEAKPCKDKQEVRQYYQRFGVLLCLVHVLQATDLHFQNIIACGEHPVLIDIETLMHPWRQSCETLEKKKVQCLAKQQLEHSVLRTSLLPKWQLGLDNQSFDLSGLGGGDQQKTTLRMQKWRNVNTDDMRLSYEHGTTQRSVNTPSLDGVNLALNDYLEEIVDGFRQMYWFLINHQQAILAPDGPLTVLAHQPVRFVFRRTKIYSLISAITLDPKFLRDGADRSVYLDILSRGMLSPTANKPLFWSLLDVEKQALEQMDIPLFAARSDSDGLTIAANQTIEKCFTQPSFNLVVSRLKQLNQQDLEQQISFIRGSIYSRIADEAHQESQVQHTCVNLDAVADLTKQELIQQAIAIAEDLKTQAICSADGSATWIAPQYLLEFQRFQLQPLGYNLYDGVCGVALFLAALEKVTGGAGFRDLALGALQTLCQDVQSSASALVSEVGIGGAVGCGSMIYGLVRSSQFLEEPNLLESARHLAAVITPDSIAADGKFDVISGAAGAILGLLALHQVCVDRDVLAQAIACGEHLLHHRVVNDSNHRTWAFKGKLLTGFSHGAAGIAYALLRLYQATGETAFREASLEANAYESSVFLPEVGNWPDFRYPQTQKGFTCMCSWCHGAAGIGLARVAALDILDTDAIQQDIQAAVNTTRQLDLKGRDYLCCGNLGRVEFLLSAARKLSQPQLLETAMKQTAQVVTRAKQQGTFGYGASLAYHPGFFQGAAGIGYELLRLAAPDILPSVLLWE